MTLHGSIARTALAAALALGGALAYPATASAAGPPDVGSLGSGIRHVVAQRVLSVPLRLSVTVAGGTRPAASVALAGSGDRRVTVTEAPGSAGLRLVVEREQLDGRLLIVNDTNQTLQITISRGRTVLFADTLVPSENLSVRPEPALATP